MTKETNTVTKKVTTKTEKVLETVISRKGSHMFEHIC